MSEIDHLVPLVVDLDGTLLKADLPSESFISVMIHSPLALFKIICQTALAKIFKSNSVSFKVLLENKADGLSMNVMPWSKKFLQFLQKEKNTGRRLILCTGSTQGYANKVGQMLNLFESTWGSIPGYNLTGRRKAWFLVDKYGKGQFDYAGNAVADLKVAPYARHFILVNPTWLARILSRTIKVKTWFQDKSISSEGLIHCLGLKLCLINSGIMILAIFNNLYVLIFNLFIFPAFNFLAIAASLFFCICNIEKDRTLKIVHPQKQCNLFATGDFSILYGLCFSGSFLFFSVLCFIKAQVGWLYCIVYGGLYILCVQELMNQKIQNIWRRVLMYFCAGFFVSCPMLLAYTTFLLVHLSSF